MNQVLTARDENRGLSQEEAKAAEPLYKAILSTKFRHWSYEEEIRGFTELNVEEGGKYEEDSPGYIDVREKDKLFRYSNLRQVIVHERSLTGLVGEYPDVTHRVNDHVRGRQHGCATIACTS